MLEVLALSSNCFILLFQKMFCPHCGKLLPYGWHLSQSCPSCRATIPRSLLQDSLSQNDVNALNGDEACTGYYYFVVIY